MKKTKNMGGRAAKTMVMRSAGERRDHPQRQAANFTTG